MKLVTDMEELNKNARCQCFQNVKNKETFGNMGQENQKAQISHF